MEEHLLQLGVGLTDITKLIVPLVDDSVRQPSGIVASLILGSFTTSDGLVVEGDRIIPCGCQ